MLEDAACAARQRDARIVPNPPAFAVISPHGEIGY